MKYNQNKIFLALFILLIVACQTKKQYTSKPSKSVINPDSDLIEINSTVYHVNDSISIAFVEVVNENLVYKRPDTTNAFYSEVKVSYKLLTEANSRKIIDSNSYYVNDRALEKVEIKSLKTMFSVKAQRGYNYFLEIQVYDLNKKIVYTKGLNVYKKNNYSEQNYLVNLNNQVPFSNRFVQDDNVKIELNNKAVKQVTVDCFLKEFAIAAPPFSLKASDELKYKPDSVFVMPLSAGEFSLTMPAEGFYHIRSDETSFEGLTLYSFNKTFPGVSSSEEMINCTRYLMNKAEFEDCKNASNQKEAIDKFWLSLGGSNERARELLKKYYGRVKEANKYYSSYMQGWKTDRGMMFIVLGQPNIVYRNAKTETWVYGVETNPNTIRYTFVKTKNPFSDNDYVLERSQFFKDSWYRAVEVWRQGHVYINHDK